MMHNTDKIFVESLWPTLQELNLRRNNEALLDGYDSDTHQSDDRNDVTLDVISLKVEEKKTNTQGEFNSDPPIIALIQPQSLVFKVLKSVRTNQPAIDATADTDTATAVIAAIAAIAATAVDDQTQKL